MHIDIIEDKIASLEMSPSQVFTQMKQHIPEPIKPRVKVEYVKVRFSKLSDAFREHEESPLYICDKGQYHKANGRWIYNIVEAGEWFSLYRKVETEIKTEKRWFAYNSKANIMETRGYKTKDDCYNTLQSNRFRDNFQYIEVDVEV